MTPTKGQTTTPSGADVDVLAVLNRAASFAARGRLRAPEYSARQCAKENREDQAAIAAVAALLARNAEMEAERDGLRDALRPFGTYAATLEKNGYRPEDMTGPDGREPAFHAVKFTKADVFKARELAAGAQPDRDDLAAENKALQSRLSGLADHCRRVYDIVPQLPIDEGSMEGATDALHAFCIMLGVNGIDIDAARTPAAKGNDDG